jgi:hypothetical protein
LEDATPLPENVIKSYRYDEAKKESGWVLPSDENYHKRSAGIAHTRSLTFLKPLLGGPFFDLEAVWEEHTKFEFGERDVAKTMATMVDQPYVNHIPTMTYVHPSSAVINKNTLQHDGLTIPQRRSRSGTTYGLLYASLRLQQSTRHSFISRFANRRNRPCD